jgi:hypothetical protein
MAINSSMRTCPLLSCDNSPFATILWMVFLFIPRDSANLDFDLYNVIGYEVFAIFYKLSQIIVALAKKIENFFQRLKFNYSFIYIKL